jgi:hypothetical protein
VGEFYVVNDVEFLQQYGTNQTVEITTGNQSIHIVAHNIHTLSMLPFPFKGAELNDRIILTTQSAK